MGWFSNEKKSAPATPSQDPAAVTASQPDACAEAEQTAAAHARAKEEELILVSQSWVDLYHEIVVKRRNIYQMEKTVIAVEKEYKKAMMAAPKTEEAKEFSQEESHSQKVQRLKARIKEFQNCIRVEQEEMYTLEDEEFLALQQQDNKAFSLMEGKALCDIAAKRRNIEQMEHAIVLFESKLKDAMMSASKAEDAKESAKAELHSRNVQRLKARIELYQNQIRVDQLALDTMEDASAFAQQSEGTKALKQETDRLKADLSNVGDTLR